VLEKYVKNVIQKEKEVHYQELEFQKDIGGKINDRNNIRLGKR